MQKGMASLKAISASNRKPFLLFVNERIISPKS